LDWGAINRKRKRVPFLNERGTKGVENRKKKSAGFMK